MKAQKFDVVNLKLSSYQEREKKMAMDLVTVNLTRDNEKEHWGFDLAGGGKDKDVRLYISQVRNHTLFRNKRFMLDEIYVVFFFVFPYQNETKCMDFYFTDCK